MIGGKAAHAGVEPHLGVNATIELAHQVFTVLELADTAKGTSVTPRWSRGGTTTNTVPERGQRIVDVRAWTRPSSTGWTRQSGACPRGCRVRAWR